MDEKLTCDKFHLNPGFNPITGRPIKSNGPTYNKLVSQCRKYPTPNSNLPLPEQLYEQNNRSVAKQISIQNNNINNITRERNRAEQIYYQNNNRSRLQNNINYFGY